MMKSSSSTQSSGCGPPFDSPRDIDPRLAWKRMPAFFSSRRLPSMVTRTSAFLASNVGMLFRLYARRGGRAFARDQQNDLAVLGTVIVHLLAEVRDEGAGRHRRRARGIEGGARP